MIVAFSMILIGLILVTGICTGLYLGMSDSEKLFARDLAKAVGAIVVIVAGFALIGFGIHGLVNL